MISGSFSHHQLRWARTIRDSRPGGYARAGGDFRIALGALAR